MGADRQSDTQTYTFIAILRTPTGGEVIRGTASQSDNFTTHGKKIMRFGV